MKRINYFLLLICLLASTTIVNAQSAITIEASQLYSSFKYQDSQNNNLNTEYSGIFKGAYTIGYSYSTDFGLIVKSGLGVRNGGADLVYDDMNYSWRLQYVDVKLGVGYMYNLEKIKPYFMVSGYYAYLIHGTQILNNEAFNIIQLDLLSNMDYGVIFSPGVQVKLSDNISSYLEFNYLMGLNNIEKDETQTAKNVAYSLTLGLSFSINKK